MADNEVKDVSGLNTTTPSGPLTGPDAAAGPLVVSEANPRYFRVASGSSAAWQYGFSQKFAWVDDKYGVSWQLNWPLTQYANTAV